MLSRQTDLIAAFTPSMTQRIDIDRLWRRARRVARAELAAHGALLADGLPTASPIRLAELSDEEFDFDVASAEVGPHPDPPPANPESLA